jgi:hypothetical protein
MWNRLDFLVCLMLSPGLSPPVAPQNPVSRSAFGCKTSETETTPVRLVADGHLLSIGPSIHSLLGSFA